MVFNVKKKLVIDNYSVYRKNGITIYYKGFFFMRGYHGGEESIDMMLEMYLKSHKFDFETYYGMFSIVVQISEKELFFFTDNSRMSCFFFSDYIVSDNLLYLIDESDREKIELDSAALDMLFNLGGVYFDRTLVKGVKVLNSFNYLYVKDGIVKNRKKDISGIDGKSTIQDVPRFFKDISKALENYKVACAITGGYDSRMVMALLKKAVSLDLFISGDNKQNGDIIVAEKVAKTAGLPFEIIKMDNQVTEKWVYESFKYFQGICPSSHYEFHNIMNFNRDRIEHGYQIALNGDGGVLHKDWEWMQDFPFYNKKKTNYKKLYRQRIKMLDFGMWLGDSIEKGEKFDAKIIKRLKKFGKESNTKTYDSYYYGVYLAKNCPYANANEISYGPLMEYDLVKYSYHLPRRERYFCNYMRKLTTNADFEVAKIRTIYGTNASSCKIDLFIDFFYQLKQYMEKLERYLKRRYKNFNNIVDDLSTIDVNKQVRKLDLSHKAVLYCIKEGYLKENLDYDKLPFALIDRALQVYLLKYYIKGGE